MDKIKQEYQDIREQNREKRKKRIEAIYNKLPEVKVIKEKLANITQNFLIESLEKPEKSAELEQRLQEYENYYNQKLQGILEPYGIGLDFDKQLYTCDKCRDTGYLDGGKICGCHIKKMIREKRLGSNLKTLEKHNFSTFNFDIFDNADPVYNGLTQREFIEKAYKTSKKFVQDFPAVANMLFFGAPGLGKSFLCSCIAFDVIENGYTVYYDTSLKMYTKMFSTFDNNSDSNISDFLRHLCDVDLLILDDLGAENVSDWTASQLFDIINTRIIEEKPTIISTNLSFDGIKDLYPPRIYSRIMSYTLVPFFGRDLRNKYLSR